VVSGSLHREGCFGGLQFVEICVECVWLTVFTFSSKEYVLATVLFSERWFGFVAVSQCSARVLVFWVGFGIGEGL
jgi:hypothetical protein